MGTLSLLAKNCGDPLGTTPGTVTQAINHQRGSPIRNLPRRIGTRGTRGRAPSTRTTMVALGKHQEKLATQPYQHPSRPNKEHGSDARKHTGPESDDGALRRKNTHAGRTGGRRIRTIPQQESTDRAAARNRCGREQQSMTILEHDNPTTCASTEKSVCRSPSRAERNFFRHRQSCTPVPNTHGEDARQTPSSLDRF